MNRYLPIFLNISDKKILIIGGGKIAFQKIKILKNFTDNLIVISPEIIHEISNFGFKCIKRKFRANDLKNIFLVYACTNDTDLNHRIKTIAGKKGILVNAVDDIKYCDFISPAVSINNNMTIAVSSNGEDTKKAIKWRNKIKELIENGEID